MRTHEFRQYCTGCEASCEGYAIDDSWVIERCVFCGSEMEGFRVINGSAK